MNERTVAGPLTYTEKEVCEVREFDAASKGKKPPERVQSQRRR